MVAELQAIEAAAIDWPSEGSSEGPFPTLRLLARVPRVGDKPQPSKQETLENLSCKEPTEDFGQTCPRAADGIPSQEGGTRNLAACRAAPSGNSAEVTSRSETLSWLCELHAVITPYAGAIVTFVLFTSAGLLYWLVMKPVPNPSDLQHQIGLEMLGRYSSGPNANVSIAPAWSAPKAQPVTSAETASEITTSGRDPVPGTAEVIISRAISEVAQTEVAQSQVAQSREKASTEIPRVKYDPTLSVPATHPYPATQYESFDFAQSGASGKGNIDRPMIARRPESNRTGQQPR